MHQSPNIGVRDVINPSIVYVAVKGVAVLFTLDSDSICFCVGDAQVLCDQECSCFWDNDIGQEVSKGDGTWIDVGSFPKP